MADLLVTTRITAIEELPAGPTGNQRLKVTTSDGHIRLMHPGATCGYEIENAYFRDALVNLFIDGKGRIWGLEKHDA